MLAPTPTLADARATLTRWFGYPEFRAPQVPAIEAVLAGHDALIVLPTGGGKSLCFQVPALTRGGLTVVISPLISLMKDQVDALERRGVPAAFINSTLGASAVSDRLVRAQRGELRLLYLAPERLESDAMLEKLRTIGVTMLAVDEAHCISEWGHDFRPSYRRLARARQALGTPHTVALTATATPDVRDDIIRQLQLRDPAVVVGGFDRTNLTYHVVATRREADKDRAAITAIETHDGPSIVYAPTRKAVERITKVLVRARLSAVGYHAGLEESHRRRAQDAFMHGTARVIVATSAFGMGIDKPDVRLVVHHAMPGTLESYYQEAGRAGRDGKPSVCVLLHNYADRFTHEYFIDGAHPDRTAVERVWRTLRAQVTPDGLAPVDLERLTTQLARQVDARHVGAAVRTLARAGRLTVEAPSPERVFVTLRATPARIAAELDGERAFDREVLRALWRAVGPQLQDGAFVNLDGLPPGLGGGAQLRPVLERLQAEQFVTIERAGGGYRLEAQAIVDNHLGIDWEQLTQRRAVDIARLDAMQGYAQTRGCRRAFVLRYFGDPAARVACGACDRCLGTAKDPSVRRRRERA
ncbi:MAG: RecQ family ATP-dependent DNA helicase [Gemmatimonadaceae bacterium]|nr:RecQ family ATP-dependent DNA helicase [Gemmatimonadaceae bacterium]